MIEELKKSNVELAAVNKELEAYSYTISHDLRAPLRSIEGFSRAITEDYADKLDATGRDYFLRVTSASRRMSQLIDALLTMSRLTQSEIKEKVVNLSDAVRVIAHELNKSQPERAVEFVIAERVFANGDPDMLRIVLENLLNNAWKFTSRHSAARIEFGVTRIDDKDIYFVRDDGAGFNMEFADKLFNPFRRFHTETEFLGLGIGLATAQKIIARHGGKIWAESDVEKGATFYFTLIKRIGLTRMKNKIDFILKRTDCYVHKDKTDSHISPVYFYPCIYFRPDFVIECQGLINDCQNGAIKQHCRSEKGQARDVFS
jgi:light-regulated signal transduction histidine kinase (bacteriophytochrome)